MNPTTNDAPTGINQPTVSDPTTATAPAPAPAPVSESVDAITRRATQAANVRAALHRRREAREKLSGEKERDTTSTDGKSDAVAKLQAEKETIVNCLRQLVEAGETVREEVTLSDDYSEWAKAHSEAKELVTLIDSLNQRK